MKVSLFIGVLAINLVGSTELKARGSEMDVYRSVESGGGFWGNAAAFNLVVSVKDDLLGEDIWGEFWEVPESGYIGNLVTDQFSNNERTWPSRAKIVQSTSVSQTFLIEVFQNREMKGDPATTLIVKRKCSQSACD